MTLEEQLQKMRDDWDERARENARHYVATAQTEWSDDEFFASGELVLREHIFGDMENICQGKDRADMRVLEIGCGAARITRALGRFFGEVHAVDISREMVARAQAATADQPNVHIYQNNGMDLTVVPEQPFDFAFSTIVFQHIPSREVIATYMKEVARLLRPGALLKCQLQGYAVDHKPDDTWVGVGFSEEEIGEIAEASGFEFRYSYGAGSQHFWVWLFRK